ncbi:MAG: DNA polymerase III subunit alpha [Bacteroidota bacterium]|nr:DNA polymerase III subunit alpha [Bacteroidota bacterium]
MFLIFDTETTGLPKKFNASITDSDNWPRMVQLAWQVHDENGELKEVKNFIIKPEGYTIPYSAAKVHGITTDKAETEGVALEYVLNEFNKSLQEVEFVVGHNISFDINISGAEFYRKNIATPIMEMSSLDTMDTSTNYCKLLGGRGGGFKRPKLIELHKFLFNEPFDEAHNASADVEATARCFFELVRLQVFSPASVGFSNEQIKRFQEINPNVVKPAGIKTEVQSEANSLKELQYEGGSADAEDIERVSNASFSHLHLHSQYSILDGAAEIKSVVNKAVKDHMPAIAITDHGNMFGVKDFHQTVLGVNASIDKAPQLVESLLKEMADIKIMISQADGDEVKPLREQLNDKGQELKNNQELLKSKRIKPILGCEVYVARRLHTDKKDKTDGSGHHLILLAKNLTGYHNLMKLVSYSWLNGFYYNPRIDKELLRKYSEGLIVSSACLGGEVSQAIMHHGKEKAIEVVKEYKEIFGEDYYLEIQRHKGNHPSTKSVLEDQNFVNKIIREIAVEQNIKLIATNDVHFINAEDASAHDRLICLSTGKNVDDENRMRYTSQEYFKTQQEMRELFADVPEAIVNISEIVDKVEEYELNQSPIMPDFEIPDSFESPDDYLKHVTYEGAKKRWGVITDSIRERLDFELDVIKNMGFPGYFLIVWDFLKAARELDVSVGPGRGSAAGSAVAYSLRITEIDPIKYDLLFERFLNPDRVSMPDIDIDFDDDGRARILKWVVEKYGINRVAHIITFGTMAAKSSIRDVARVQQYPLSESDKLAKLVPEKPGMSLKKAFELSPELKEARDNGSPETSSVLKFAQTLEGSVRNTGTHACGIIIGKDDLENYVPVSTAKDSELTYVTQYDGRFVEDIGLLKMDFLGLKTLSIIKDAVKNIKLSKGVDVDIENVPLEDEKTYELYANGETTGLFQFESDGMKKYLRDLKPTRFEDLIAMNALYRPGPLEYIPSFVKRKNGEEPIVYDLPEMEEHLKETYGITVYQEQVMLLSRKLGGFTRGESDTLRKAMGKKKLKLMAQLKVKFEAGCKANGHPKEAIDKIWSDWEAFAKYAFNKSHATCYSYVSYQTAYLKAHYPAEFMAAVLSRNMNDIKKVTSFIDECQHMGINVLGPDVNESYDRFTVNKDGEIRFGMVAIKGVGENAVEALIEERTKNGLYKNILDLVERVSLKTVNKKSLEALALAGGFDGFNDAHRKQYLYKENNSDPIFLDKIVKYGNQYQQNLNSAQASLFGESNEVELPKLEFPKTEPWTQLVTLKKEKEVIGFYLSGHPLDEYRLEMNSFCNVTIKDIKNGDLERHQGKTLVFAGIVSIPSVQRYTKNNKPFGNFVIEDFSDSMDIYMFGSDYTDNIGYISTEGHLLLIRAKVQKKRWSKDGENDLELKIINVEHLAEALETLANKMFLKIDLEELDSYMVSTLHKLIEKYPGNGTMEFTVIDKEDGLSVRLPLKSRKIDVLEVAKELSNYKELKVNLE